MEAAVFRPALRNVLPTLVAGAGGGALLGAVVGAPFLLSLLFGAVAAALAVGVRQLSGVRVVASAGGLAVKGGAVPVEARWEELRLGFGRSPRADGSWQRYAIVADGRGRSFAFADFAGAQACEAVRGLDGTDVEVMDLKDTALLLAVVVQRAPAWHVLPPALLAPPVIEATVDPAEPGARSAPPRPRMGLLGLAGKLAGTVAKAAKTANFGWAAASAATYGILFSWKFAIALLVQLFVHEYGHVHAMRKTGMNVRGMYFVPFLGAIAVTDDAFTSRRQQAYVALNGPLWGSIFALVPVGLWFWTRDPLFAAVAAWWAVINLFNLLPIAPLDGGRVMQAFAFSFSSSLGVALTILGLGAAVGVGTVLGYELVWIIALLGALELVAEAQSRAGGRALRLLPERARFGPAHFRYLRAVAGPPLGSPSEVLFARDLQRMEQAARAEPLRPLEVAAWGLGYAALAGGLLALVHFMSHVPGANVAAQILS
ncbi:site-2 protease family protein [Anaeromyxobacter sp. Fw109-5]|uniref:site-2 protease family protein n=1 Tax=Anaeromyxobacter sp. (strain Fw109-5) TaxID=404589 RepID=UPI0000ED7159|nr:site-2 protease family protein [Anaeromyxobacter sp. Fw109-5]ABS27880.1 peptidase M50 [Anaeromyxobacter sp. Fw109-5]